MTGSLRSRAVRWYGLWLVLVFGITGVLVLVGFRHYLERTLAASQRTRALRIAGVTLRAFESGEGDLRERMTVSFAPEATGRFVAVTDHTGRVLYRSGPPQDQSFDPALIPDPTAELGSRRIPGAGPGELLLTTIESGAAARRIRVATADSIAPLQIEERRLLATLLIVFAILGLVAIGGGYLLVDRALRPVGDLTRSAEGITSRNLSERLPEPATADEFGDLSRSLNRMIARLEEAFQHNRRFLDDASHELRTPLTVLRGELEALNRESVPGRFRDTVASLLDEVERLARLVENLFALSRLDAGRPTTEWCRINLIQLATATAEQMRLLAEDRGLQLEVESPMQVLVRPPVWVEADPSRLKQVIVNLLDNAFNYTPRGGSVGIVVRVAPDEAVLEVWDTGIGIPAEALPRVFDRFFRVDPSRSRSDGGSGIGLSIVKAICAAHRGRVEVLSTVGKGSRFSIHLPLVSGDDLPRSAVHESTAS